MYKLSDQIGDLQKIFGGKGYVPDKVQKIMDQNEQREVVKVTPIPKDWK